MNQEQRFEYLESLRQGNRPSLAAREIDVHFREILELRHVDDTFIAAEQEAMEEAGELVDDAHFQAAISGNVAAILSWQEKRKKVEPPPDPESDAKPRPWVTKSEERLPLEDPNALWARQKGESRRAYEWFIRYRDMGAERGKSALARQLQKSVSHVWTVSKKWNWDARADAWDDERDRVNRLQQLLDVRAMSRRHTDLAVAFQEQIVSRLHSLDVSDIRASDLPKWLDVATKIERTARGEPETIKVVGHRGGALEVEAEVTHHPPDDRGMDIIVQILQDAGALSTNGRKEIEQDAVAQ